MAVPEEGVSSLSRGAERLSSFGRKYFGEREGLAPLSVLAAGADHA